MLKQIGLKGSLGSQRKDRYLNRPLHHRGWHTAVKYIFSLVFLYTVLKIFLFIYLAASGLSRSKWGTSLHHSGSVVAASGLDSYGSQTPGVLAQ